MRFVDFHLHLFIIESRAVNEGKLWRDDDNKARLASSRAQRDEEKFMVKGQD